MEEREHQASALEQRLEEKKNQGLPPRSQTHKKKTKKEKLKGKHPLLRFLVICFLLVPFLFLLYMYYGPKIEEKQNSYDKIQVKNEEKKNKPQTSKVDEKEKEEQKETVLTKENEEVEQEQKEEKEYVLHTVEPGETLYTISMKYYQTRDGEMFIKSLNNLSDNELEVGNVLKIPSKEAIVIK